MYCSFTSYSIDQFENIVQDYLEALLKELDFVAKTYAHKELQTMYIGGGTPTSLKEEDLEYLDVYKRQGDDIVLCDEERGYILYL